MLTLGEQWATFSVNSELSDVFYDDGCQKICTVKKENGYVVTVKGFKSQDELNFRIDDKGKIKVIKLSPDSQIASIQREGFSVEFLCFVGTYPAISVGTHFTQTTKLRSARILELHWITSNQILFVTNQVSGLELYQVNPAKGSAKFLKICNISLFWANYYAKSKLLIVASGISGSRLTPFLIQHNNIYRLAEFDVDFGCSNAKSTLLEREVFTASIYGSLYVLLFRYSLSDSSIVEVSMYKISGDNNVKSSLAHSLILGMTGPFALHVIDNIVIVHHQVSGSSFLFDIGLKNRISSEVSSHKAFAEVTLALSENLKQEFEGDISLYSPRWIMFPQNIVIETNAGFIATVSVHPERYESFVKDEFSESSIKYALIPDQYKSMIIDQSDLIGAVFLPALENSASNKQFLMHSMLQYLQNLQENNIDVLPFFLNEILVPTMVAALEFNCLQQLLQYRVIPDAKQLAFFLLSHEAKHGPLVQFAVDMLARLGTAAEEIVEVLLSKGHVVEAIRLSYLETSSTSDKINLMKLLEYAWKENRQIQYAVFMYCKKQISLRNHNFTDYEQFSHYLLHFNGLFNAKELEDAKRASQFAILPRDDCGSGT
uniref:Mic1 domain-containing protein n=1 Tax=Syphacia muris TaxID=451379 RepID=A0A0N5AVI7_9BILA